ncbi:unnamed protein product [Knipowitschia caucasica]
MAKRSGSYKKYLEDGTERIPKRTRNRWKLAKRRKEAVPNEENNEDDDSLQNVVIHDKNFTENEDEENSSTGSQEIKEYPSESEMDMFDVDSIEDENVETEDLDFNAKENAPQCAMVGIALLDNGGIISQPSKQCRLPMGLLTWVICGFVCIFHVGWTFTSQT